MIHIKTFLKKWKRYYVGLSLKSTCKQYYLCYISLLLQIAIAALHIACVMLGNENQKSWFAELNVDMDKVTEIVLSWSL